MRTLSLSGGALAVLALAGCGTDPSENAAPTASFTAECTLLTCAFDESSTDPDGSIDSYLWSFDDGTTSEDGEPSHEYATGGRYDVSLTVTDDDGSAHSHAEQVSLPTGSLECESFAEPDGFAPCAVTEPEEVAFRFTLAQRDCTVSGIRMSVRVTEPGITPREEVVSTDLCNEPLGLLHEVGSGDFHIPGTSLKVYVTSDSDDPERIAHALRRSGASPEWTLHYEDGEDAGGAGEPDYADLTVTLEALPNPCGPITCE